MGVLVYFLQDLPRVKGRVPVVGKIVGMDCDQEGNLMVLEQNGNNTTLSTYILRK